ncbi:MAG: leucine-rich repeat domain-containing protein [Roseburia sp.]|nr:leucine-rich repeat domain-containing protein [Roseburia sp.]MCM1098909.1 leucine-rich repeat domain-containing protein [Ruminococcus flavefaciens]
MTKGELELTGGSLYYEIEKEEIRITDFQGLTAEVVIPDRIEGYPVREVGKKAFLSKKRLRRVTLPRGVREVGDWAFAYCDSLREVSLPRKEIRFGRAVFLECGSLRRISAREAEEASRLRPPRTGAGEAGEQSRFQPELLAAAVGSLGAYYLLDIPAVGSGEWLEKWDAGLASRLRASDQEGYSRQVLCGEEDYGSTDLAAYTGSRRREKVRLTLLRLLFPRGLSETFRSELERYLLEHTKGEETDETWRVILEEHGEDRAYYQLFAELGCLNGENLGDILGDIGERYPEMKAFFLRERERKQEGGDFFAGLEL